MTIKTNGDIPECSFCNGVNWKKLINKKATEKKDTNIHKCRECGSVVDFGTKKEDILHALYHHNPREEPPIRSIIDEGNKK